MSHDAEVPQVGLFGEQVGQGLSAILSDRGAA